ncbi:hypothetical protein HN799_00020 [Candidatus Woesearchaeota archaeon]|nr:hypothetical protein [Candidatus Woesearchaeota archaeon]
MAKTELQELRKKTSKRKPTFVVKEWKFGHGVKRRWRFPRGKHSKVRQMHKGRPVLPGPGFGSPKEVFGMDKHGLYPILVKTVEDITKLNPAKESALISGKLGNRKRLELLSLVQEKNITLSDGDVPSILNKIKSAFDTRKKLRQEKLNVKSKKEQEKEKQAAEQEKKVAEEKKSSESSVEEKIQQEEKKQKEQKSEAEKTIIKPQ